MRFKRLKPPFDDYGVDSAGRVWSFKRTPVRSLSPHYVFGGGNLGRRRTPYARVSLYVDGKKHNVLVHVLICTAFHGAPWNEEDYVVCHWDGDSLNNCPENLRWGTVEDNVEDRKRHASEVPF